MSNEFTRISSLTRKYGNQIITKWKKKTPVDMNLNSLISVARYNNERSIQALQVFLFFWDCFFYYFWHNILSNHFSGFHFILNFIFSYIQYFADKFFSKTASSHPFHPLWRVRSPHNRWNRWPGAKMYH